MKEYPTIAFGEWLPDQPKFQNAGLVEAKNTYPMIGSYGPFDSFSDDYIEIEDFAMGGQMFFKADSDYVVSMGAAEALYLYDNETETTYSTEDLSTITETDRWRFERFNDLIIAVAPLNDPHYVPDLNSPSAFVPLTGSPPQAEVIGRLDDFIVLGNIVDATDGSKPNRVQWSAFNDPTAAWVTDPDALSGYKDLPAGYGKVTGISQTTTGAALVFQERAIHRMIFVGAPLAFDFEPLSVQRGCVAPDSIIAIGSTQYFLSQDGFFSADISQLNPIGDQRVNRWFLSNSSETFISQVAAGVNWQKQAIVWGFVTGDGDDNRIMDKQIIYSFSADRWSNAALDILSFVRLKQDDLTIGDLDDIYGSIGEISAAIGSDEFLAQDISLGAFTTGSDGATLRTDTGEALTDDTGDLLYSTEVETSFLQTLTGGALAAEFETGAQQLEAGRRTSISGVMPLIENGSFNTSCYIRSTTNLGGVESVSDSTTEGADGFCPQKVDARFVSVGVKTQTNDLWDKASGAIVRGRASGRR
jgi:hypothetical protein